MTAFTLSAATAQVRTVRQLIERHALGMHFQPIVDLQRGSVIGHEALVRPPTGCRWSTPDQLFDAARTEGAVFDLEMACVQQAVKAWATHAVPGKLFINLSASALLAALAQRGLEASLDTIRRAGVASSAIVIELTEHERVQDVAALVHAAHQLRRHGVTLALDDFGDGRSSLRLWSELKPDVVKIDKYFAAELAANGDKLQTFRALLQLAEIFGSQLVAEGIETSDQLRIVRDLGVSYGQGFHLGRPTATPAIALAAQAHAVLRCADVAVFPTVARSSNRGVTAARLAIIAAPLPTTATHADAIDYFAAAPDVHAVALVDDETPVALVHRQQLISQYAKPYFKELFARKPVLLHANDAPLTIDLHTGIEELTTVLTSSDQRYLTEGFIITEGGRYRGLGTGEQLVRTVTEARIEAARHANPLTFLPGNIPITDHITRLLGSGREFVACYADLNHFKPFNDHYGYWRGDEMIRLVAKVASAQCDPQRDFLGHVGGDDFILLFQSSDWRTRCEALVGDFDRLARELFDSTALEAGGIMAEDRQGVLRFHPCTTLCVGAVAVPANASIHSEDVASAAATAKRQAKQLNVGVHLLPSLP